MEDSLRIIHINLKGIPFYIRSFFYVLRQNEPTSFFYVSSSHPLQHILSLLYRSIQNVPTILDVGEWHSLGCLLQSSKFKLFMIELFNQNILISSYSGVAAISSAISLKCHLKHIRSFVMPALLPSLPITFPCRANEEFPTLTKPYRLFYSGTLKDEDGISNLLDALSILENRLPGMFRLVTSGSFSADQLIASCYSSDLFNQEIINHKGFLSSDEYLKEICNADFIVIPRPTYFINNHYSFPTRLVHALSLSKPVAISDSSDIPIYLRPNFNYISLGDGTSGSIVDALLNPSLESLIQSVVERIPETLYHFDPATHASNLVSFASSL